jgi:sentrin-specific protease 1
MGIIARFNRRKDRDKIRLPKKQHLYHVKHRLIATTTMTRIPKNITTSPSFKHYSALLTPTKLPTTTLAISNPRKDRDKIRLPKKQHLYHVKHRLATTTMTLEALNRLKKRPPSRDKVVSLWEEAKKCLEDVVCFADKGPVFPATLKIENNSQDSGTIAKKRAKNLEAEIKDVQENKWRGLENYDGSACYVNSSLQQLFSIPLFIESISKNKEGHELVTALYNLWMSMKGKTDQNKLGAASALNVKVVIDKLTDKFKESEQHDSHEFLGELIDRIHDELSGKKENDASSSVDSNVMPSSTASANNDDKNGIKLSQDEIVEPVDEFFRWNVQVCLKCKSCGYSRFKVEMYRYLPIDIGDEINLRDPNFIQPRVDSCLNRFFSAEDREVKCEKCKEGKIATQTMKILSKPKVMLLHLKRFFVAERQIIEKDNSTSTEIVSKKRVPVELTTKLSIDKLLANESIETSLPSNEYSLKSIVYHIGNTANSGHYTTDALRKDLDTGKDQWVSYNDAVTVEKSIEEVVQQEENKKTAYMLMYSVDCGEESKDAQMQDAAVPSVNLGLIEEEAQLQQALAMSMNENEETAAAAAAAETTSGEESNPIPATVAEYDPDGILDVTPAGANRPRNPQDRNLSMNENEETAFRENDSDEANKRAASLMRTFNEEEQRSIRNAIYGRGRSEDIMFKDGTDSVQRQSMHTLKPGTWLNDEIIHYFYLMLSKRDEELCKKNPTRQRSHFFRSFFITKILNEGSATCDGKYEYSNVKQWSEKVPGKDIFKLDKILFPINMGNMHWIAAAIFMKQKRIEIFDSLGSDGSRYLNALFSYIQDEHMDKKKTPLPDIHKWESVPTQEATPRQRNGTCCMINISAISSYCNFVPHLLSYIILTISIS